MPDRFPTGTRIRDRRLEQRVAQVDLAAAAGISASYLNLIEHNRRPIAGKVLHDIARALGVDPALLSEGSEPGRLAALRTQGAAHGLTAADLARVDDLALRFPGWAGLIEAQGRQIARLDARVTELSDRLEHDPALARALHEILTAVTAIHSSAAILVEAEDLDRDWQARFSRNIHDESSKLTDASRALVGFLDRPDGGEAAALDPQDEVERWLTACGGNPPGLDSAGPEALAEAAGLSRAATWILLRWLRVLAADAADLPLPDLAEQARAVRWDPVRLSRETGLPPGRLLRRLAALPRLPGQPPMALVIADAGGALFIARPDPGLTLPRVGACPLWPVFAALAQPGRPLVRRVQLPGEAGAIFLTHSVAEPDGPPDWTAPPPLRATMLVTRTDDGAGDPLSDPLPVGRTCRLCPRPACSARREPPVLAAHGIAAPS